MKYQRLTMKKFVRELKNLKINLDKIKVIAEIGAEDGADLIELAGHMPHALCYAIEGLKDNYDKHFEYLSRKNIKSYNVVISDYDGKIDFYEKEDPGVHGIFRSHWSPTIKKHRITCYRFDTFIAKTGLPIPDMVKIDVEGASYEVIKGFGEVLKKVKVIQLESETKTLFFGQKTQNDVFNLLNENYFKEFYNMRCCEAQYDSIFVNKKYEGWLFEKSNYYL